MPRHDLYACELPIGGSLSTIALAMRHMQRRGRGSPRCPRWTRRESAARARMRSCSPIEAGARDTAGTISRCREARAQVTGIGASASRTLASSAFVACRGGRSLGRSAGTGRVSGRLAAGSAGGAVAGSARGDYAHRTQSQAIGSSGFAANQSVLRGTGATGRSRTQDLSPGSAGDLGLSGALCDASCSWFRNEALTVVRRRL
jgi:hypothetical protein